VLKEFKALCTSMYGSTHPAFMRRFFDQDAENAVTAQALKNKWNNAGVKGMLFLVVGHVF